MYNPKPVNTGDIDLSEDLLELTEKIAANVHDVWAQGRLAEGWVYGERKDSDKKTTPLLVPYNELPEGEKEYDRKTVLETIKMVLKCGYEIKKEK